VGISRFFKKIKNIMAGISTIFSLNSANDEREVCLDLTGKVSL